MSDSLSTLSVDSSIVPSSKRRSSTPLAERGDNKRSSNSKPTTSFGSDLLHLNTTSMMVRNDLHHVPLDNNIPSVPMPKKDKGKGKMKYLPDLPEEVWQKVFQSYYEDCHEEWHKSGIFRNGLTPLLLSKYHSGIALPILYRHPHLSHHSIDQFINSVELPLRGSRSNKTAYVKELTIRPTLATRSKPSKASPDIPYTYAIHNSFTRLMRLLPHIISLTIKDTILLHYSDAIILFDGLRYVRPKKARIELRAWDLHGSAVGQDIMIATRAGVHTPYNGRRIDTQTEPDLNPYPPSMRIQSTQEAWRDALYDNTEFHIPPAWYETRDDGQQVQPQVLPQQNLNHAAQQLAGIHHLAATPRVPPFTGFHAATIDAMNQMPNVVNPVASTNNINTPSASHAVARSPAPDLLLATSSSEGTEDHNIIFSGYVARDTSNFHHPLYIYNPAGPTTSTSRSESIPRSSPSSSVSNPNVRANHEDFGDVLSAYGSTEVPDRTAVSSVNASHNANITMPLHASLSEPNPSMSGVSRVRSQTSPVGNPSNVAHQAPSVRPTGRRPMPRFNLDHTPGEAVGRAQSPILSASSSALATPASAPGRATNAPPANPSVHAPDEQLLLRMPDGGLMLIQLAHHVRGLLLGLITEVWSPQLQAFSFVAMDPLASIVVRAPRLDFWPQIAVSHIRVQLPRACNSLSIFKGSKEAGRDREMALRNIHRADTHSSAEEGSEMQQVVGGDGHGNGLIHGDVRLFEVEINTVDEMKDDVWIRCGSQLPPQLCRILVGMHDWRDVSAGVSNNTHSILLSPVYPTIPSPATSQFDSPTFSFATLDSEDDGVSDYDLDPEAYHEGATYDAEKAAEQARKMVSRRAA